MPVRSIGVGLMVLGTCYAWLILLASALFRQCVTVIFDVGLAALANVDLSITSRL